MPEPSEFPRWDPSNPDQSLRALYEWAIRAATERMTWYKNASRPKKRWSQLVRASAITLGAIGGLCPLFDSSKMLPSVTIGQWGYLFIAVAAAFVLFDRLFGLSSSWMRFMLTELTMSRAIKEFQLDWTILMVRSPGQTFDEKIPLQRVRDFISSIESMVKQETDAWIEEFRSSVGELEKLVKSGKESLKPGNLRIVISNAKSFDSVAILLNSIERKRLVGVTEGIVDLVPPGRYEVMAIGHRGAKESKESKVVEIKPDAMEVVEFKLQTDGA